MMNLLWWEKSGTIGEKKTRAVRVEPMSETNRAVEPMSETPMALSILSFEEERDLYEIEGGGEGFKLRLWK